MTYLGMGIIRHVPIKRTGMGETEQERMRRIAYEQGGVTIEESGEEALARMGLKPLPSTGKDFRANVVNPVGIRPSDTRYRITIPPRTATRRWEDMSFFEKYPALKWMLPVAGAAFLMGSFGLTGGSK
jgi:hypothetical protein